jgi:dTMP kinase
LLDPAGEGWNPRAEALLFAAARSDHVERLIRPALEAGRWVICDRFVESSRAYQGGAGGLDDNDILTLHRIGSGGLLPDLTVLIEVSPQVAIERTSRRDGAATDRIGGRDAAYHAAVVAAFGALADADPGRFVRVLGNGSREETHAKILAAVTDLVGD